jgi:shikimate kinase
MKGHFNKPEETAQALLDFQGEKWLYTGDVAKIDGDGYFHIMRRTLLFAWGKHIARSNIILTGFMATGKTTIGRLLAGELGYEFIDTDHLIEDRCGQTIAEIFREKGEAVFRTMEADVARELGGKEGLVIATGGGLILDPANVAALKRQGRIFCLVATPEAILERASRDAVVRPLIEDPTPLERIKELMKDREKAYMHFTQVESTGKTADEVVRILLALL